MAGGVQCSQCKQSVPENDSILFGAPHDKELRRICIACFEGVVKEPRAPQTS